MLAALLPAGAGCGRGAKNGPEVGGESHFLHWCGGSCEEDGLECISAMCTQRCVVNEPNACAAFGGATCTDGSIEAGSLAVCDVSCGVDADCAGLGAQYRCEGSFCRAPQFSTSAAVQPASEESACARPCLDMDYLNWQTGGLGSGADVPRAFSALSACGSYSRELATVLPLYPVATNSCSVELGCSSSKMQQLNLLLNGPDPNFPTPLSYSGSFGLDAVADDVMAIQLRIPGGGLFVTVGPPCGDTRPCRPVPPVIEDLVSLLRGIDTGQSIDPSCAGD
jgi:hypothetical protein